LTLNSKSGNIRRYRLRRRFSFTRFGVLLCNMQGSSGWPGSSPRHLVSSKIWMSRRAGFDLNMGIVSAGAVGVYARYRSFYHINGHGEDSEWQNDHGLRKPETGKTLKKLARASHEANRIYIPCQPIIALWIRLVSMTSCLSRMRFAGTSHLCCAQLFHCVLITSTFSATQLVRWLGSSLLDLNCASLGNPRHCCGSPAPR
jgi:hypothetical protein